MAITFTGGTGLFDRIGKIGNIINVVQTHLATTLPTDVNELLDKYDAEADKDMVLNLPNLFPQYQSSAPGNLYGELVGIAEKTVIDMVNDDNPQPDKGITTALEEVIRQMKSGSREVKGSVIAVAVAADAANDGNGAFVTSTKGFRGLTLENAFAEDLVADCTADAQVTGTVGQESFFIAGELAKNPALDPLWPDGSSAAVGIQSVTADQDGSSTGNMLSNGSFDTFTTANTPDDWYVAIGTIGTTVKETATEVQTVAIAGTPTGGTYRLVYTDPVTSAVSQTDTIAYNAAAAAVKAALGEIPGLENITVTSTGTSPNYTHTVTFKGVGGNVAQMTSVNSLTGGSPTITHGTTTNGSANVYVVKALEIVGDGSQLTELRQEFGRDTPVELEPLEQYAVNMWIKADVVPAAGVLQIALVDGAGTVINDEQGTANSFTKTLSAATTSFVAFNGVFRTPRDIPQVMRLRIKLTTAMSVGSSLFIDHLAMTPMTPLYTGGPYVSIFGGSLQWNIEDRVILTVSKSATGLIQTLMDRLFGMRQKGLLLPSVTDASEDVVDSLIS